VELELLKFRPMEPSDAKEYKEALLETLDDLKLYKSSLVEHPNISVKKTELMIRANQYFQKPNEDYFVLMNGRRLVAYGYAVQRPDDEWSELGLWVRKSYQGRGCGSHMLGHLAQHAFDNHPSMGVYVIHDFSNLSMGKVAESLGFETDWIRERELESEVDIGNKQSGKVSGIDVRQSLIRSDMGSLSI
jgi:RimJ/RimL family protein N-acetyltransferase